jgi:SAM-dependent methyltransferase
MAERALAPELLSPVLACVDGRLPANVALMQLVAAAPDSEAIDMVLQAAPRHFMSSESRADRLEELRTLRSRAADGLQRVKDIAAIAQRAHGAGCDWARAFDELARISPEASVALYSLGDPVLLERQTAELVAKMAEWDLLRPRFRVLDFGCGIGRVSHAIATRVAQVIALDVSQEMARLARERTAGDRTVSVLRAPPDNLQMLADARFDVVLAIDSFPYVVESGRAEAHFREITRILAPDGRLLMMNYSYRGNPILDQSDVRSLAERHGFELRRNGTADLSLWDGRTFLLHKR